MDGSGLRESPVPDTRPHTVALTIDLNETPPPSPREEDCECNGDGYTADHRCGLCGETEGEMVVCGECVKQFHVVCLGGKEEEREWKCVKCSMECGRGKKLRGTVPTTGSGGLGLLDMNASPPREADGDEVGFSAISELALPASVPNMQDACDNLFVGFSLTSLNG
ncbi:methyl-CpG-binding domain-containing protein 9-like, partial [Cynara cardunculus var. scolymus]|uniref:methyl-CpG-binding domain-containing protein 9-like n=1 Tax=Cynara cardunculus var. scolymus TaxID=59895 RepID=UPI000D63044D